MFPSDERALGKSCLSTYNQSYGNGFGSLGSKPMMVKVQIRLLHVLDEVRNRNHSHQLASFQVQLCSFYGCKRFLRICKDKRIWLATRLSCLLCLEMCEPQRKVNQHVGTGSTYMHFSLDQYLSLLPLPYLQAGGHTETDSFQLMLKCASEGGKA